MSDGQITIKVATTDEERRRIYRLRYDVYIAEQGKAYPNADHDRRELYDRWDEHSANLYAECDGRCVGAVRYTRADVDRAALHADLGIPSDGLEMIPDVWLSFTSRLVLSPDQRRGLRTVKQLMVDVFNYALQNGIVFNAIQTASALIPFFERFGFVRVGKRFVSPSTHAEHQSLLLVLDDEAYLRSVGSPFLSSSVAFFGGKRHPATADISLNLSTA